MAKQNSGLIDFVNNNFFWFLLIIIFFGIGFFSGSIWNNQQAGKVASVADTAPTLPNDVPPSQQGNQNLELTPAINELDHTKGASNPKITLVEYADFTCGFCARNHPTLQQIVDNYPDDVAWIYRHYLLSPTGPARLVAQASECIAEYEGNDQFWTFINTYYTRSQDDRELSQLGNLLTMIQELGMNRTQIETCIDNDEFGDKIDAQIAGGRQAGVAGTPATVLITSDGEYDFISGAAPYESFQEKIEQYL